MSPPPKTWTRAMAERLARVSLGDGDGALARGLAARLGWLRDAARGEDLAADLAGGRLGPRGPAAEELERLSALHQSLLRQLARPEGRLQKAKAFVLRVLRLYTRAQVDWNRSAMEVLAAQDRALAAILVRLEALERDRDQGQSNRSSDS